MRTTRWMTGLLTGVLLLANWFATPVAAKPAAAATQQPISIEADELYFSDKTGEMFARGNVIISQGERKIFADLLRGNERAAEVWTDGRFKFSDPLTAITGMKLSFNYGSQFAVLGQIDGKCGDMYLSSRKAEFFDGKFTLYDSTTTTCKMKGTPDYRITAGKVEIWPGVKLIAYNAQAWIKNFMLYSTPRYQTSLKRDEEDKAFPRFGFQNRDGFYISQHLAHDLSKNISLYTDLAYYSKAGLRPTFGIVNTESDYTMRLETGFYRDNISRWVRKDPEFRFELKPRRLGKLPFEYKANLIIGRWSDEQHRSWHQDYNIYITHDPIYFDAQKTWELRLGGGVSYIQESYDGSNYAPFRYNVRLSKKISPVLKAWTGYNYNSDRNPLFAYEKTEVPKEGVAGLSWKATNKTTLSYSISYDFTNKKIYEHYYTLKQNFHCWETEVTYRSIKKELLWTFTIARW